MFLFHHESFLVIDGKILDIVKVKVTINGLSYLFNQIQLETNRIKVDSLRVHGVTFKSSLKEYLSGTTSDYNIVIVIYVLYVYTVHFVYHNVCIISLVIML